MDSHGHWHPCVVRAGERLRDGDALKSSTTPVNNEMPASMPLACSSYSNVVTTLYHWPKANTTWPTVSPRLALGDFIITSSLVLWRRSSWGTEQRHDTFCSRLVYSVYIVSIEYSDLGQSLSMLRLLVHVVFSFLCS